MFKALSSWFGFSLCILGYFCATTNPALAEARLALEKETAPRLLAQVTSDDTVNTQVTENGNTAEITGGETRGDNLFHSFQDFSVKTGNEAFFNNADSISNIFSRVTGGNVSDIDGAIRANGGASLFLINADSVLGIEQRPLNKFTNDINASSEVRGLDGSINIDTSDINPIQGATELPSNIVEAKQTADQTCSADRDGKANNGLAIAGRGGIHPAPDTPLNSENISKEDPAQASIPKPLETSQGKIQPARGIKISESGKISLTAYRTDNAGERITEIKPNCN